MWIRRTRFTNRGAGDRSIVVVARHAVATRSARATRHKDHSNHKRNDNQRERLSEDTLCVRLMCVDMRALHRHCGSIPQVGRMPACIFRQRDGASRTPLLLGALTVLIPCGITQTMMALAIGTEARWKARRSCLLHTGYQTAVLGLSVQGNPPRQTSYVFDRAVQRRIIFE